MSWMASRVLLESSFTAGERMLNRYLCLHRRVSLRIGLLLVALGLAHLVLSGFWVGYFQLTGHVRSISVEFVSGLAIGLGMVLLVSSLGSDHHEPEEGSLLESEQQPSGRPAEKG